MKRAATYLFGILACLLLASCTYADAARVDRTALLQVADAHQPVAVKQAADFRQPSNADIIRWTVEANSLFCLEASVRLTAPCEKTESFQRTGSGTTSNPFHAARNPHPSDQHFYAKGLLRPHTFVSGRSADYHVYALRRILI